MSIRPDYCPVGNVPCQSLCEEPCTTRSSRLADEALMRQALQAFEVATTPFAKDRQEILRALTALRARLESGT